MLCKYGECIVTGELPLVGVLHAGGVVQVRPRICKTLAYIALLSKCYADSVAIVRRWSCFTGAYCIQKGVTQSRQISEEYCRCGRMGQWGVSVLPVFGRCGPPRLMVLRCCTPRWRRPLWHLQPTSRHCLHFSAPQARCGFSMGSDPVNKAFRTLQNQAASSSPNRGRCS